VCGNERAVSHHHLKRGKSSSCGCLGRIRTAQSRRIHIPPGTTFGRLTVVTCATRRMRNQMAFVCQCACGKRTVVPSYALRSGAIKSCGCLRLDTVRTRFTTHGKTHTTEHSIWTGMLNRCRNPKIAAYVHYGGRGITVCDRWRSSFTLFLSDMGPRPSWKHSIDRIDNDGPYSPENCRWATPSQQANNSRHNRRITHDGVTKNIGQWAKSLGVTKETINARLKRTGSIVSPTVIRH
jgi:hypothetical protein